MSYVLGEEILRRSAALPGDRVVANIWDECLRVLLMGVAEGIPVREAAVHTGDFFMHKHDGSLHERVRTDVSAAALARLEDDAVGYLSIDSNADMYPFVKRVWSWRRLAENAGQVGTGETYPPLAERLREWVDIAPYGPSEILSLVAGWGQEPSLGMQAVSEIESLLRLLGGESLVSSLRGRIGDATVRASDKFGLVSQYSGKLSGDYARGAD